VNGNETLLESINFLSPFLSLHFLQHFIHLITSFISIHEPQQREREKDARSLIHPKLRKCRFVSYRSLIGEEREKRPQKINNKKDHAPQTPDTYATVTKSEVFNQRTRREKIYQPASPSSLCSIHAHLPSQPAKKMLKYWWWISGWKREERESSWCFSETSIINFFFPAIKFVVLLFVVDIVPFFIDQLWESFASDHDSVKSWCCFGRDFAIMTRSYVIRRWVGGIVSKSFRKSLRGGEE